MVSDSNVTDGTRVWSMKKVFRVRGSLVGLAGIVSEMDAFLQWYKAGARFPEGRWSFSFEDSEALILTPDGLFDFEQKRESFRRIKNGYESIGSGAMSAIAAHEALDRADPKRAVAIACKHDAGSRAPVRLYTL